MFNKKILSVAVLGLGALLTACDTAEDKGAAPMNEYTFEGKFAPGSYEDFKYSVGDRVFFDTDKHNLKEEAKATLQAMIAWLNKYPNVKFTVEGHADERGTSEYNLALSERRAAQVRKFMIQHGISAQRIETTAYGKERPDVTGNSEEAWAKNRRAVVVLAD